MPQGRDQSYDGGAALITGASAGIGRALALEFARGGFPVVLVARDEAKLEKVAEACRTQFGITATVLPADLENRDAAEELFFRVRDRGIEVDVLVNNAGSGLHGKFVDAPLESCQAMVQLQISTFLELTKYFLPPMLARKRGRLLNVASVYAFTPVPNQALYGACKSFLLSFSTALADEVQDRGVTVTVLCPGITTSEFRQRAGMKDKKPSLISMTPEAVAKIGYLATVKGVRVSIPGWFNYFFISVVRHLPSGFPTRIIRAINQLRGVNSH